MLVERSELFIKEGQEEAFHAVMVEKGLPLLAALEGVGTISFGRGLENPDKFMLMIEWDSMDAHMAFTRHPSFPDFKDLLSPFTKGGAMEHFNLN